MRTTTNLRIRPDARLETVSDDETHLVLGPRRLKLRTEGPRVAGALALLAGDGVTETELATTVASGNDRAAMRSWSRLLAALRRENWLEQTVRTEEGPLVTLRPVSTVGGASGAWLGEESTVIISRFAGLRREGSELLVESPRAGASMTVHDARVGLLFAAMATASRVVDLNKTVTDVLDPGEVRAVVRLMIEGRLALIAGQPETGPGARAEVGADDAHRLDEWNHQDLLLHSRSRMGRHTNPYGGTYRFVGRHDPLPVVKERTGATVALPRPDLSRLAATDPSLTEVVESRASIRRHDDDHPITAAQLGELLYRTQRLRWVHDTGERGQIASRPYASGGGLYELEVYPVVHRCEGLAPGMYRYAGEDHVLETVAPAGPHTGILLEMARGTALLETTPQVLLVVAARFGRVMWKYESVAYAVILKNVGSLYQSLYLAATAMGLAPCALGGGDSDVFADATGLRYENESSVGEFIVGSRPAEWTRPADPELTLPPR